MDLLILLLCGGGGGGTGLCDLFGGGGGRDAPAGGAAGGGAGFGIGEGQAGLRSGSPSFLPVVAATAFMTGVPVNSGSANNLQLFRSCSKIRRSLAPPHTYRI